MNAPPRIEVRRHPPACFWMMLSLACAGCRVETAVHELDPDLNRMLEVPRYDVYEEGPFFHDKKVLQEPPDGTVPIGTRWEDPAFMTGKQDGQYLQESPVPLTRERLELGRQRFDRTCATCHGPSGDGDTIVANFMPRRPPSLHSERVLAHPDGKIFDIVSHGFGLMPDYASQLTPDERWAVVAYLRVLQQSRAPLKQLPDDIAEEARRRLVP